MSGHASLNFKTCTALKIKVGENKPEHRYAIVLRRFGEVRRRFNPCITEAARAGKVQLSSNEPAYFTKDSLLRGNVAKQVGRSSAARVGRNKRSALRHIGVDGTGIAGSRRITLR